MSEGTIIQTQLDQLREAMQATQTHLAQLDQQHAALTQQREQAVQVLLHQRGAIQSAEDMLKKLQSALCTPPRAVDGVLVES